MIKYVEHSVVFSEFPDEICLAINLSLCPNHCPGCSQSYLANNIGEELTLEMIDKLVKENPGITMIGFMGGDNDHESLWFLTNYIHLVYNLKVGMYSGQDVIDLKLADVLDYYKVGSWRMFTGDKETWKNQSAGPICLPTSNQVMYKRVDKTLINITDKFRKNPINNWESVIINDKD